MQNADLLAMLDRELRKSFKALSPADLGQSLLNPTQFERFVRAMEIRPTALRNARRVPMPTKEVKIDRISFPTRIITSGKGADGTTKQNVADGAGVKPTTATETLDGFELVAVSELDDDTLRQNIERGNFEQTLLELMGEAAGRDFEEWAFFGDTGVAFGTDEVLSQRDGWLKRAGQRLFGVGAGQDFDGSAVDTDPEEMFEAMLSAIPKKYLQGITDWVFYVDWGVENGYREKLKARGTDLGDRAQTGSGRLAYKGIPVVWVPGLELAPAATAATNSLIDGRHATLQNVQNMAWGVFEEVRFEPDRRPRDRQTDFVLTFHGDMNYEDPNAAVTASIEKES